MAKVEFAKGTWRTAAERQRAEAAAQKGGGPGGRAGAEHSLAARCVEKAGSFRPPC